MTYCFTPGPTPCTIPVGEQRLARFTRTTTDTNIYLRSTGDDRYDPSVVNGWTIQTWHVNGNGSTTSASGYSRTHIRTRIWNTTDRSQPPIKEFWTAQAFTAPIPPATEGTVSSGFNSWRNSINNDTTIPFKVVTASSDEFPGYSTPEYVPVFDGSLNGAGMFNFGTNDLIDLTNTSAIRSGFVAMTKLIRSESDSSGNFVDDGTDAWLDTSVPTPIWRTTPLPNPLGEEYFAPPC